MKTKVTEKDTDIINAWYEKAKKQTVKSLPEFIRVINEDYEMEYGAQIHAMAACGIAGASAMSNTLGATGSQGGKIPALFQHHWLEQKPEIGSGMISYDHLLFPQHETYFKFLAGIPKDIFIKLQYVAEDRLKDSPFASPSVIEHWKEIAAGTPPFGLKII